MRRRWIIGSSAWFALGAAVAFIAAAAIDVHVLGHVERMKGANTTFLIFAWLTPVVAIVMAAAYALGAKVWACAPARSVSVVVGGLLSLLWWLLPSVLPDGPPMMLTWVVILGGSFVAPRTVRGFGEKGMEGPRL